jgi:tetratricopeptide (TPR) repeat protein
MPRILDVEAALLLLELEPPFDQRGVQLARRRMAKRWHPDIAPPGRRHEHQRHLQAINEAADELERLAESSRGGRVSRTAVKVSAAATRRAREEAGRRGFSVGIRTVPAGSLQFVDFSKPDPAADRVQRFMTAAQHALAEGDAELAARRLVYARDAEPANPTVLRLLTAAFWQAGNLPAAARTVRDWARAETDRPTPERFASRIYEDMGALDLAAEAAARAADRAPADSSAWERLGRLRLRLNDRRGAISAFEQARLVGPTVDGLLDLALAHHLAGDVGAEVSAAQAATQLDPESPRAWSSYAHALARTDRLAECEQACRRALALGRDAEVSQLLKRVRETAPRGLAARSAA